MTRFASRENSEAEQRAILNEIVETFDATEVTPTATGLERARQLAAQAIDIRETEEANGT